MITSEWVRTAHADAWQELGRQRSSTGGGCARLPGVRLMASGLPHPQWNSCDVEQPELMDLDAVRHWYAERGVPWGARVPSGASWSHGRNLRTLRLMGLTPELFTPAELPDGLRIRVAGPADADAVLDVDTAAFDALDHVQRPWLQPLLAQPAVTVVLAELSGTAVGTGHCLNTDGPAGRTAYLAGIGVVPDARRRGVGAAISSWLVEHGFGRKAALAHLHPDADAAAAIYRRLGFVEVDGLTVYVDLD